MKPSFLSALLISGALASAPVVAEEAIKADALAPVEAAEIDMGRDAEELRVMLRAHPDIDTTDTALVFNNPTAARVWVRCAVFNGNGRILGGGALAIPANGVRFFLASDLARDRDFIGSAQCGATNRVLPSSFILGAGLTDAPVNGGPTWTGNRMRFPIVAAF
ncbi:MAG: hypothetical protein AAF493_00635 [Pseudomonadota bacterium]